MEADLECMELNRDRGDCAEGVLYGVGDGDGKTVEASEASEAAADTSTDQGQV